MKLPVSETVSLMALGWLSPSGSSRDRSMYGLVTFADVLHVKFLTLFALLLQFSFNSLALPLLTSFRFSTPSFCLLSFAFALFQRLCFFGVSIYCKFNVIFCISSKISPAIVQYPIALVSSGFDGSSIPPADARHWYFTFIYLNCFLQAVIYLYIVLCLL